MALLSSLLWAASMLFLSAKLYIQLLSLEKSTGPLIGVSFISQNDEGKDLLIWNNMYIYEIV